jgi:hypothetical protein
VPKIVSLALLKVTLGNAVLAIDRYGKILVMEAESRARYVSQLPNRSRDVGPVRPAVFFFWTCPFHLEEVPSALRDFGAPIKQDR